MKKEFIFNCIQPFQIVRFRPFSDSFFLFVNFSFQNNTFLFLEQNNIFLPWSPRMQKTKTLHEGFDWQNWLFTNDFLLVIFQAKKEQNETAEFQKWLIFYFRHSEFFGEKRSFSYLFSEIFIKINLIKILTIHFKLELNYKLDWIKLK